MKQTQYAIEAADLTRTFGDLMAVDARAFFYNILQMQRKA
jgi:hypothetical protein